MQTRAGKGLKTRVNACVFPVESSERRSGPVDLNMFWAQITLKKTDLERAVASEGKFPVKVVAETLGLDR